MLATTFTAYDFNSSVLLRFSCYLSYSTSYKTSIEERGGAPSGKDDELLFLLVLSPSTFRNVWTFSNSRIGAFSCSYSDQFCLNIFQQAFGSSLSNKESVSSPVARGSKFLLVANCNTAISGLLLGLIERERCIAPSLRI